MSLQPPPALENSKPVFGAGDRHHPVGKTSFSGCGCPFDRLLKNGLNNYFIDNHYKRTTKLKCI
jgi:hypothetical protein